MVNKVIEEGGFRYFKCKKCGKVKPLTPLYFYRNSALLTGYTSKCRECVREENSTIYKPKNKPITKAELEKENKKLKEDSKSLESAIGDVVRENRRLKEENKKLKSDLHFERNMLDNVRAEYKSLQNVIKKMEEERIFSLGEYDYMILTSTTPQLKIIKKNQNYSLMEEDTLQELRDLGKI